MKISFRNATREDLPAIVEIYNSTVPGRVVTADTNPVSVESRVKWFEDHSPAKRPLWIVEDEAKNTVGWASIGSFYGRPAYDATTEVSIYLHVDHRGKGFGKQILRHVEEECKRMGIKTLLGFIFGHNEPSLQLFRQAGYEEWGVLPNVAILDDVERTLVIVGKRITP